MSSEKKRVLMKAFIESQFSFCPLIWMFHGRKVNSKINHLHERTLRIVYSDNDSSFERLLDKDQAVTIHLKNVQSLAIEVGKVKYGLSTKIMNDLFEFKTFTYDMRSQNELIRYNVNTETYGLNSIKDFASKVWRMVPSQFKTIENFDVYSI